MAEQTIELIDLDAQDAEFAAAVVRRIKGTVPSDASPFLAGSGNVAYAVLDGEDPVGWAYGYILDRPDGGRMMMLYEMEVVPNWRRKGIGRRLVAQFRERAETAGCQSMWLMTDADNVTAQMLYQLEGATTEGPRLQFAWRNLSGADVAL